MIHPRQFAGRQAEWLYRHEQKNLATEITTVSMMLGDLKKRSNEIKKDHDLAMELWSTREYYPRLLATLIFDKKLLAENAINRLASACETRWGRSMDGLSDPFGQKQPP